MIVSEEYRRLVELLNIWVTDEVIKCNWKRVNAIKNVEQKIFNRRHLWLNRHNLLLKAFI